MTVEFIGFPKIARYSREVIVTEKIDGTSGQIFIDKDNNLFVSSHTRWITPESDNFGFAVWTTEHKDELLTLGPGRHYGEWWGCGIQRNYGLKEKKFSLFNVTRWCLYGQEPQQLFPEKKQQILPACVSLVPILWRGLFDDLNVEKVMLNLQIQGSQAAPGFMKPEGIVIYHTASGGMLKKTFSGDSGKWKR